MARLPQDMCGLLAVAIRDLIWFKPKVVSFFKECQVPASIMVQVKQMYPPATTVKVVQFVLDQLSDKGDDGIRVARAMLTRIYYWKDMHTIEPERKDKAVKSLKALQDAYKLWDAQRSYQEKIDRDMHDEREKRVLMKSLDHDRLQKFRDEFDAIHLELDPQKRGNLFQDLMNRIFDYYCDDSKGAFERTGEQIDGLFYFDKHWYYVEIRWRKDKANAADVSILRDRAKSAFGGDTKALFISFNGFSEDCIDSLRGLAVERVILMDGYDLRCVLDSQIGLDVLLAEKQALLIQFKRPFVGAQEIMVKRRGKR